MNNEHIRTWKNTATAQLEVISHPVPGEAEASTRNLSGDNQIAGRDLNRRFPENKADMQKSLTATIHWSSLSFSISIALREEERDKNLWTWLIPPPKIKSNTNNVRCCCTNPLCVNIALLLLVRLQKKTCIIRRHDKSDETESLYPVWKHLSS